MLRFMVFRICILVKLAFFGSKLSDLRVNVGYAIFHKSFDAFKASFHADNLLLLIIFLPHRTHKKVFFYHFCFYFILG